MGRIPTTDLYFVNSCGHKVARWLKPGPVKPIGANSFAIGDTYLLIRRDTDRIMRDLLESPRRLVYLVDDDIEGAATSPSLPEGYRKRLMEFHSRYHGALTRRADILVATSPVLLDRFAWHTDVRLLHPVWHLPMAGNRHFDGIEEAKPIRAVHLGSGSHSDGIAFLRPVLTQLIDRYEQLHFTYIGASPALGSLDDHARVQRMKPQSWRVHKRWLARQRFHLGLYPLPNTPFHRARSRNKILEYGIVGAVGVYPADWQPAQTMKNHALLCSPEQRHWTDTLSTVLSECRRIRALSECSGAVLDRLNDPANQRAFWSDVLKVDLT